MEGLRYELKIDIDKIFYKSNFFLNWAKKSKNLKTREKLIKKGIKEISKVPYEYVIGNCKIEMVKEGKE